MSENKHTPEPWRTAERSGFPFHIDDARGESVAMMLADDDHDEQRGLDNARRIVACVNACAGIPTEMLEERRECAGAWFPELENAKKQRDELLAALEWCTIERACRDLLTWGRRGQACPLSVNISSASLVNAEFAQRLCERLDSLGLKRGAIVLELTEHDAVPDVEAVRENARLLDEGGIQLSLDDFGSGYSGLTVLARFQFSDSAPPRMSAWVSRPPSPLP